MKRLTDVLGAPTSCLRSCNCMFEIVVWLAWIAMAVPPDGIYNFSDLSTSNRFL